MKTLSEWLQLTSQDILVEAYENLIGFDANVMAKKEQYKAEVWKMLQDSYKKIGGIKGSGFNSEADMMQKIWFWKLYKDKGTPIAVIMYKDRAGRKMVALGTDGTDKAKSAIKRMMMDEITHERSYGEASGPALSMVKRLFNMDKDDGFEGSPLEKYMVPSDKVGDILKKPVRPVSKYEYIRAIGGDDEKKVMFGVGYRK